jgi:hypothetical protein
VAKDWNAATAKFIDGAEHQWNLWADDNEVRGGIDSRLDNRVQTVKITGQAGCLLRNAGIAGSAENLVHPGRLLQLPNQRVFAASAAQHKNLHDVSNRKGYEFTIG